MREVVLIGAGHTHAHVLRAWASAPPAAASLTCVSPSAMATYSGMLPGVLAGDYAERDMLIDIGRLTDAARAKLVVGEAVGLDPASRLIHFADRPPIPFDIVSIGIGSTPTFDGVTVGDATRLVGIKPMSSFFARFQACLDASAAVRTSAAVRIAVIGGGAAGVEVALCLAPWIRARLGAATVIDCSLVTGPDGLLPGGRAGTIRRLSRACRRAGVVVRRGLSVVAVSGQRVTLDDGTSIESDVIIWTTGAVAPPLLARTGLATDTRGFLLTDATLRAIIGAPVFAVGDAGTLAAEPTAKAGVYAVRQGPVLWSNIRHLLAGRPLTPFRPQKRFLRLFNVGTGRAVGEWGPWSFEGRWVRRWKDHIDQAFMNQFR